jgi:predicted dehydrogenase
MATHNIGIIMNGVTGRMGTNQHLIRSICSIREQGGVKLDNGDTIMPEPLLLGRNPDKLKALAEKTGIEKWTTDINEALADPNYSVYFDAQTTNRRFECVKQAIAAGKHIYCEKPASETCEQGLELYRLAKAKGVKTGVVQDKLWLPGLLKLKQLIDAKFFGRIITVRGEFGYWVFEGDRVSAQRPSWNYRKEDGGGIIVDMLCHFSYVLESLFGLVQSVNCLGWTHIPERIDEDGKAYHCTAEDACYTTMQLQGDIVAHFNASWCVRVRRDDLLTIQVDGTEGTAVAGLRRCWKQDYESTPKVVWNPDIESPIRYFDSWTEAEDAAEYDNAFKAQWELFLKHIVADEPFRWNLLAGARNVLLAEKGTESWQKRTWIDMPELNE